MTLSSWRVRCSFAALLISGVVLAAGCGPTSFACPQQVKPALEVVVIHARTGRPLCAATATVVARDGAFSSVLEPASGCLYDRSRD